MIEFKVARHPATTSSGSLVRIAPTVPSRRAREAYALTEEELEGLAMAIMKYQIKHQPLEILPQSQAQFGTIEGSGGAYVKMLEESLAIAEARVDLFIKFLTDPA